MLFENRVVARLQRSPDLLVVTRNLIPSAYVTGASMIRSAVRNGFFDGGTNRVKVIRQVACVEVGLYRHHAATDVYSHSSRDDGALRRANAPMHIGHRRDPLKNEGKLSNIQQLLTSLIFELHSLRPSLDRRALLRDDYVVSRLRHFILPQLRVELYSRWFRRGASQYDLS